MASIDDLVLLDTYKMPVRHRVTDEVLTTDDGKEMYIEVANADTPEFKRLRSKYRNEQLRSGKSLTAEKEDARLTEMLVTLTKGWLLQGADGLIKFSKENARALYQDERPQYVAIKNQVVAAAFDDANFMGESLAA